jgi:hypothetical protein
VDNKHNLVVATHTINRNDLNALGAIALEAKKNLGLDTFTVLVDKATIMEGNCPMHNNNITTIVAHPTPGRSKESVTQPEYLVAQFQYNKSDDTYTCPQGEILKPREDGTRSGRTEQSGYQFKKYRTPQKIVQ